jgi:hypothetical protein
MSKEHAKGLITWASYYLIFCFGIQDGAELHSLCLFDLVLGKDGKGLYVKYHERALKNGHGTWKKFQNEHFHPPVRVYNDDVHDTFTRYISCRPRDIDAFFLNSIDNPQGCWYAAIPMGLKCVCFLLKLIFLDNGLDPTEYSNKSGRATLVTRMSQHGVPREVFMRMTGHFNLKSYSKYDTTLEAQTQAAQRCVADNIS